MRYVMRAGFKWLAVIIALAGLGCEEVAVVIPQGSGEPVRFGAAEIGSALKAEGIPCRMVGAAPSDAAVVIALGIASPDEKSVPMPAESYAIRKKTSTGRCALSAMGRDETGAMYAALDVAEQIRGVKSVADLGASVEERTRSPHLRVRGVNLLLLKDGLEQEDSYFHSPEYWRKYMDMLARCRFNFLDLHGAYDVMTTGFPNLFPYLIRSEKFPQATAPGAGPEKNLAVLKGILALAKARGIKVGLMNCTAGDVKAPEDKLAEYTRDCVATLLRECPDLYLLGFRIGESGQREDFFKKTYLAAAGARGETGLYTRSWLASRSKIMDLAAGRAGKFFVEIKYCGEHLGLPYLVASDKVSRWGSCSYQAYSNYPRNYEILYQVMAGGTFRIFPWGDPEFAARCVRSCAFAEAAGFSLEPIMVCSPQTNYFINREGVGEPFFTWPFERHWFWHMLWGRLAYDPDTPERVWIATFKDRFGDAAGESVYRAVALSSKVVPLIYAAHCLGADRRRMAPEMETGDDHRRGLLPAGGTREQWQGSILDFTKVGVLDETVMASVEEYAESQVSGRPNAKFSPLDVAQRLSQVSLEATEQIEKAQGAVSRSPQEYRCLRLDIEALQGLAVYYAEKIRAATSLELYRRTKHFEFLGDAQQGARDAMVAWDALSRVTARHYRPLVETLRMCTPQFTWAHEGEHLRQDLVAFEALDQEFKRSLLGGSYEDLKKFVEELQTQGKSQEEWVRKREDIRARAAARPAQIGHMPIHRAPAHEPLRVSATVGTSAEKAPAWLCYRREGEEKFRRIAMALRPEEFGQAAFIPAEALSSGKVDYYIEAGGEDAKSFWPEKGPKAPQSVRITNDTTKPIISPVTLDESARGDKVRIRAKITDNSAIANAVVRYKATPSFYEWQTTAMRKLGDLFEADVPLTPEGLLYYFEAYDESGNGTIWPDFLKETPYYTIRSWEPAWVAHDFLSLREGMESYLPSAGQRPFTDGDVKIEAISVELKGLVGFRISQTAAGKASLAAGAGYEIPFKLSCPARMFVGFGKSGAKGWGMPQTGWTSLEKMELKVGQDRLTVCCRDFPAGEHCFAFARGCGVVLGFKRLGPNDAPVEPPWLEIGGEKDHEVWSEEYLTVPAEMEVYSPGFAQRIYTDRGVVAVTMPDELKGLLGLRFAHWRAATGGFRIPFKLSVPARLYVAFAKPGTEGWESPHPDFTLYKKDSFKPSEGGVCDIYFKDFAAGQSAIVLEKGTAILLGFRRLSEVK